MAATGSKTTLFALSLIAALVLGAAAGFVFSPEGGTPTPAGSVAPSEDRPKVVLAIQPTDNAAAIQSRATELEQFLETETGFDFEIVVPLTYTGVVEALRFGHADVAMMSAWPSALAVRIAGAEIVLAENREVVIGDTPTVAPYYVSDYVVKKESAYQTMEDLRGKTVAYPSLTSTSGYVYPVAKLVETGLVPAAEPGKEADPKRFFGNALVGGGYAGAWQALDNGQADVAVIAGDVSQSLYFEVLNETRILETQGPVPSHAVVFSKEFAGTAEAEAAKAAFLELKGDRKDMMRKLVSAIFVEFTPTTSEQHTAPLAAALQLAGFKFQEKL
ncbi:MAG: phosphate/phosphite/phosphonate ABC transporter substrate-binding protein [Methanobacteriota archaeon]